MIYGEYIFQAMTYGDDREAMARGWKEIVRCKDCAKKELCSIFRDTRQDFGYCAWAGRKEE